jgi:hypothetical protein
LRSPKDTGLIRTILGVSLSTSGTSRIAPESRATSPLGGNVVLPTARPLTC